MDHESASQLKEIVQQRFGFSAFRPGQEEAIRNLMEHKRVLCIQPTGYGKSLLYQLPSLLFEGMTLVISPLLALMRDQLQHLNERFGIPAATINTDQSDEENARARREAGQGRLRILFIAPEQLDNLDTQAFLETLRVSFLVVDEAHCISTWGHDFRPSYRQIIRAVHLFEERFPGLHVLGLTATADRRTEEDIAKQLRPPGGPPLRVLRANMDRPNIALSIHPVKGTGEKLAFLAKLLPSLDGCGILYCATREQTEVVAEYLSEKGLDIVSYHAGYDPERKRELQRAFLGGVTKAIAATNALGMGIDKPDIRFIVHVDVPGSITAYYQEVGRAGRDGQPARGFLLFDPSDRRIQDHFIRSAQPTRKDFDKVRYTLRADEEGMWPNLTAVKVRTGLHPTRVTVILAELSEQGFAEKVRMRGKQVYKWTGRKGEVELSRYERRNQVRGKELEAMLTYARGQVSCLMGSLREALGDVQPRACGRCSLCVPESLETDPRSPLADGARDWLSNRDVPIPSSHIPKMSEGMALLNSDLRAPLFVRFMRCRALGKNGERHESLPTTLQALLTSKLAKLAGTYRFCALLPLPSRTWLQRVSTANLVAGVFGIPVFWDLLAWREVPEHRQGGLHNNDQRKQNVQNKMAVTGNPNNLGTGAILILDDYFGSGATLKEAVRALRKESSYQGEIVPLTMARVKWRLGAAGMI